MSTTKDLLMDEAEQSIRHNGYNAVSFRELADALGIKSASVHYHFPKKEDLGIALVDRYHARFFENLDGLAKDAITPKDHIQAICETYRAALRSSEAICLCGILGAESWSLPDALAARVNEFFDANIRWLMRALPVELPEASRRAKAESIVATLQGAMMMATALKRHAILETTVEDILQQFTVGK